MKIIFKHQIFSFEKKRKSRGKMLLNIYTKYTTHLIVKKDRILKILKIKDQFSKKHAIIKIFTQLNTKKKYLIKKPRFYYINGCYLSFHHKENLVLLYNRPQIRKFIKKNKVFKR